ncbi:MULTISPECIES: XRE family transcriptional regulator [unclassified Streptomyces]|uniref:helix-turn-helix domain-containing protein n=1 Tax=Streptomycetaceae TaxID=2062 RepID=UPI002E77B122|nr:MULTISPECIES: XRE family transcriptional regulator [unclassified Streptomyces]MED7947994.1 XRE family transcriptional regulator [Streptomyces sp. BE303]MEE1822892.1 XRE family transcriptional regulator [Streptomyces sp. BE20]
MSTSPAGPPADPGDQFDDHDVAGLAARLREHRLGSRLTLEVAAARVGLSQAYLSRLETGRRQPSLPVLLGLARAYGTSVSGLLGESLVEPDPVVRGGAIEPGRAGGWGYRRAGAPGRAMQALRVHVPPGVQDTVVRVHPGEEWLYVLQGRLRLTLGDRVHLLAEGDSAHFDSLTPHCIAADSAAGVELLFMHTLLQSPGGELCLGGGPAPHH